MAFIKVVENFACIHCGSEVRGMGYTNHCPQCLWSRHVDVEPGDRAAACGGAMEPVAVEGASPHYTIVHRCLVCGVEKRNAVSPRDDADVVIAIAKARSSRDNAR